MPFEPLSNNPIAILATPKTGNLWVKYVLVNVLGMHSAQFFQYQDIVSHFSDVHAQRRVVFHAHVAHNNALQTVLDDHAIKTIALVRNPLDIFLSLRQHVSRLGAASPVQARILSDDPDTLREFARTYFLGDLAISAIWARRGAALVRYEDLLTDPFDGFADLARQLGVAEAEIERFANFSARMSDISDMRANARADDREHFTTAEIDKWRLPRNRQVVSALLQSPSIRSAMRLWGYL